VGQHARRKVRELREVTFLSAIRFQNGTLELHCDTGSIIGDNQIPDS
jgi:hypothetical protein